MNEILLARLARPPRALNGHASARDKKSAICLLLFSGAVLVFFFEGWGGATAQSGCAFDVRGKRRPLGA